MPEDYGIGYIWDPENGEVPYVPREYSLYQSGTNPYMYEAYRRWLNTPVYGDASLTDPAGQMVATPMDGLRSGDYMFLSPMLHPGEHGYSSGKVGYHSGFSVPGDRAIIHKYGGLISRLQKRYNSPDEIRDAINQVRINKYVKGGRKYDRNSKTDAGDLYYDIVRQRRNAAFNALLRSGETPENAARLAPLITTQQTMEGGWRLNRKDNNYGGMRASGKTIAFDSEDAFQDAYLKMLDSKWHTGRAAENSWRSAQNLDDWARILNREDLGLHTEADWSAYNKGRKGNDFVYLYAPEWENNNKPYREHLRKTEALTKMYLDMLDKDEPYRSLVPMPEYELPEVTVTPQSNAKSKPVLFNSLIPASVMGMINNREDGGLLLMDYRSGGKIMIKPSKRGTFTAAAKKHGKSVQAFASQVLAHKENYSPAMVKKANFARNSARWHADGGIIDRLNQHTGGDPAKMLELIQMVRKG